MVAKTLEEFFLEKGAQNKLLAALDQIGSEGENWLRDNISGEGRIQAAKLMADLLIEGRPNVMGQWSPKYQEPVALVRSSGDYEIVVYLRHDKFNTYFRTLEEQIADTKKQKTYLSGPWNKANFFFFQPKPEEIPDNYPTPDHVDDEDEVNKDSSDGNQGDVESGGSSQAEAVCHA